LHACAGKGGNGCVSWRREKFVEKGGPDGGDGARGGHVILKADNNTDSLVDIYFAPHQRAQDGGRGGGQTLRGKAGKDLIVKVPLGTEVWDAAGTSMVADLVLHGDEFIAAHGGNGGLGNYRWRTKSFEALTAHTDGEPGELQTLKLELKLVADASLAGFPNAGKSSLLTAISSAHPKIGSYPFTTLNPVIGTVVFDDYSKISVADLPGLIKGAHEGIGLGHAFLRHMERARCLVYVLDMAGTDGRNPTDDYLNLKNELELHKAELIERPSLIVANKMDLEISAKNLARFTKKTRKKPILVSTITGEGIDKLKQALKKLQIKAGTV
ncbi:MAG: Obg family GTPase CgtA, partial [bacterium]